MPKKVRPGSKRLPPWQTPQTQCRGSYSRKMLKKGVFEQAKGTFSLHHVRTRIGGVQGGQGNRLKGSVSGEPRCTAGRNPTGSTTSDWNQ